MATADEYAAWIVKNADKKGTPDFDTVAKAYQAAKSDTGSVAAQQRDVASQLQAAKDNNPTNDMSESGKYVAGYGKAGADLVRGVGQRIGGMLPAGAVKALGLPTQEDIDYHASLDAPLMKTGSGRAGNISGNVMPALMTVAIPAAATIPGAVAIGAGLGGIQPTVTGESALKNANMGGALGGGALVLGNAIGSTVGAAYRGLKALAEPFTAGGPQRIAGRTLERFADNPASVAGVTNNPTITGARPTLAEQTGDRGLARLQDSLRSVDPQIENQIAGRLVENNGARVNALRDMAGGNGARDFAVANRGGTAEQLYGDAFKVDPGSVALTAGQQRSIDTLMKSPAIQSALGDAQTIAQNSGKNVGSANASGSIEGMHHMKLALDDAYNRAVSGGKNNLADSIKTAQKKLTDLMEQISPDYATARSVYADMSRPINQMDVAGQLAKKGFSNGSDLSGNPTINRNALLGALKDEPALTRAATGRDLGSLSDVMEPAQLNMLRAIAAETDRAGAVATAGNGPGAATAQRLASQNILRQTIAPGAPGVNPSLGQRAAAAVVDNTLANTLVGKATNWMYSGIAEPKIQNALMKAVLSPEEAQLAISAARQQGTQLPGNLLMRLLVQARSGAGGAAGLAAPPSRNP